MPDNSAENIVSWLCTSHAYPQRPERVEHIETHISHVFLAGEFVYKLKKQVRFDFLDYSTIDARQRACCEEVRLNRRLTTDVYLDVVPIVRDAGGEFRLGGDGERVDWLVWMRRLPTELTLESRYQRNDLRPNDVDRVAETLVRFYRSLTPMTFPPGEYGGRCEAHVRGNRKELLAVNHHLPRGVVERIHGFQLQQLLLSPDLFEQRVRAGKIVDGHGDLRPEHICIGDNLDIFDCIEFSADFRRIDVADEVAFLAAECDFLGGEWIGGQLLALYKSKSGDDPSDILLSFYKSYRACVRAKVAAIRADQTHGPDHSAAVSEAQRHLQLADRYTEKCVRPMLLVVGGLSGTGKSTLAKELANLFGAEMLRTDVIRRDEFGHGQPDAPLNEGIYNDASRERIYERLFEKASALLADQIPVVLDGTFSTARSIARARSLLAGANSIFLAVETTCRPEVAHRRIQQRKLQGNDVSDASSEVHDLQRLQWESWPDSCPSLRVDSERPLDRQCQCVVEQLRSLFAARR